MDQKFRDQSPQGSPTAAPCAQTSPGPATARLPYAKPQIASDHAPLLALLSSQCDGVDTPSGG